MASILRTLATGFASLGAPLVKKEFPAESRTPFSDDRKRLLADYRRVEQDLRKTIDNVSIDLPEHDQKPALMGTEAFRKVQ